jgi:hypothetical protein
MSDLMRSHEQERKKFASDEIALEPGWAARLGNDWPSPSVMIQAAEEHHRLSYPSESWGARIGLLWPDLARLTLSLEVPLEIAPQLKSVVECAKKWTFPIGAKRNNDHGEDTDGENMQSQKVLKWDGSIDCHRQMKMGDEYDESNLSEIELCVISFR